MTELTIRMVEHDDLTACHTIEVRSFPPCEAAWTTSLENRINHYPEGSSSPNTKEKSSGR